jgi:hypothetical protein
MLPLTALTCSSSAYDSPTTSAATAALVYSASVESLSLSSSKAIDVVKYISASVCTP